MIDLEALSAEQRQRLRETGYFTGRQPIDKPKRKQAGREPSQLESSFNALCRARWSACAIVDYWVKPMILRIGPDMTFEPDFMVISQTQTTDPFINITTTWLIDTKGPHSWEDSRIKIKIAAEKFPCWRWLIVTRPQDRWRVKEVTAAKGIGRLYIDVPWINGGS